MTQIEYVIPKEHLDELIKTLLNYCLSSSKTCPKTKYCEGKSKEEIKKMLYNIVARFEKEYKPQIENNSKVTLKGKKHENKFPSTIYYETLLTSESNTKRHEYLSETNSPFFHYLSIEAAIQRTILLPTEQALALAEQINNWIATNYPTSTILSKEHEEHLINAIKWIIKRLEQQYSAQTINGRLIINSSTTKESEPKAATAQKYMNILTTNTPGLKELLDEYVNLFLLPQPTKENKPQK